MSNLVPVVYVGNKPHAFDNIAHSGKSWQGKGDVQEVTDAQAKLLLKYPDQWALANEADRAAVDLQHRAVFRIVTPRGQGEPADRGDRRQGFAAEAERGHRFQIVERTDLARRVPRHRQRQFFGRNAAAVVANADQAHPAFFQIDVDTPGAGVERVFDQLLDHRCRPLYDLAGGDLVDQGVGKCLDRHAAMIPASVTTGTPI